MPLRVAAKSVFFKHGLIVESEYMVIRTPCTKNSKLGKKRK